ncbi:CD59 glycoprotein-like isoform X1 [Gadus macrocephalus]|uniref:CD59 glycoprotein-like isoform X1 n=1 Tax=Gadus macrocephalus TaxID=80720 RepID=UPI0028CB8CF7|nr:CD59 glycoprotein-like isoform X1 [Gadus macrocephalus]
MKTLAVVLVLALAFGFGEALRCNRCISRSCSNTVETCSGPNDVCASVIFLPPAPINFFRRCMKASDCFLLSSLPSLVTARCCETDLCN